MTHVYEKEKLIQRLSNLIGCIENDPYILTKGVATTSAIADGKKIILDIRLANLEGRTLQNDQE